MSNPFKEAFVRGYRESFVPGVGPSISIPANLAEYLAKWPSLSGAKEPAALWKFDTTLPIEDAVGSNDFITDNNSSYLFAQAFDHPDFPGLCCIRNGALSTDYLQATTLGEPAYGTGDITVITVGRYPNPVTAGTNTLTTNRSTLAGLTHYYTGTGQQVGANWEDVAGNSDFLTAAVGESIAGKYFLQMDTKSGLELDLFWAEGGNDETLHKAAVATLAADYTPSVRQRLGGAALGASAAGAEIAFMAVVLGSRYVIDDFDVLAGRVTGTFTEA